MRIFFSKIKKVNILQSLQLEQYTRGALIAGGIALLLISNLLVSQLSLRIDLSQGKAYTLSPATKKLAKEIKKPVTLSFFVSSDLPAGLQPLRREVTDLLDEYDRLSNNISIIKYDPKSDTDAKKRAQEAGLPEIPFQQQQRNKFEVASSYFGIVIEHDKKKEIIPQVTDVESLEYNITSLLYKLSRSSLPKVAIVGQESVPFLSQNDPIGTLKEILRSQYDIQTVSLPQVAGENEVSTTTEEAPFALDSSFASALIFVTSSGNYDDTVATGIKKYLDDGGKAMVFMNGISISDNLQTASASASMQKLISGYGITIEPNVLLSTAAELINVGARQGTSLLLPYPMWLRTNQFDSKSSYFANTGYFTFPWVSSLKLQNGKATPLIWTTNQSWKQQDTVSLDPQQITEPSPKDIGQFIIGAEATTTKQGKLFVIPSERFAADRYAPPRAGNIGLVLNVLNDYASQGALSGIRQRTVAFYPLPDLPQNLQNLFQYANILILPGIFALYGAVRIFKRSRRETQIV